MNTNTENNTAVAENVAHTPGPLTIARKQEIGGVNLIEGHLCVLVSPGYPSKVVGWVRDTAWPMGNDPAEGEANALLWAAAPDLLAALENLACKARDVEILRGTLYQDEWKDLRAAIEQAKEAGCKALGR